MKSAKINCTAKIKIQLSLMKIPLRLGNATTAIYVRRKMRARGKKR